MHNKAWVADGRVAIIGGRNIGEEYFAADTAINFRDLDLLLFGPAVAQASSIFDQFWNSDQVVPIAVLNQASPGDLQGAIADIDDEALQARHQPQDRQSEGEGKTVSVRVDLGGRRYLTKKKKK